jgi:hypothetical protein
MSGSGRLEVCQAEERSGGLEVRQAEERHVRLRRLQRSGARGMTQGLGQLTVNPFAPGMPMGPFGPGGPGGPYKAQIML